MWLKTNIKRKILVNVMINKHTIVIVFIICLAVFVLSINSLNNEEIVLSEPVLKEIVVEENTVYTKVPAIDKDGNGILLDLFVKAEEGDGRIFTDIENLIFWTDTQESIKTARLVAEKITNISTKNIDLTYTLKAGDNTSVVGGSSAGAILTVATVAVLTEQNIDPSVLISGGINENGTVFEVGGLKGKISIAKEYGVELFLVPKNTIGVEILTPIKNCDYVNNFEICEVIYDKTKIFPLQEELNITIVEVSNIFEVLRYYGL